MVQLSDQEFQAMKRVVDTARTRKQLAAAGKGDSAYDQLRQLDRAVDAYDHVVSMNRRRERLDHVPPADTAGRPL
jgi:hypothetical protein